MDDDAILAEIDGDYTDATMIEFDDDFPLSNMDGDMSREEEIFNTIKLIYTNKGNCAFDVHLPSITGADFFDVTDQDIEAVRVAYSEQCPALWAA